MLKKISEMTDKDKAVFLEKKKRAMIEEQGIPWEIVESKILEDIENTLMTGSSLKWILSFVSMPFLTEKSLDTGNRHL